MSSHDPSSYGPSSQHASGYDPSAFAAPPPGGGTGTVNVPGRIALIAAGALTLFQVVRMLVIWSLPIDGASADMRHALNITFTIVEVGLALVAVIFGGVGLGGRPRPRGAAAAGLALGASTLLFTLFNVIAPLVY